RLVYLDNICPPTPSGLQVADAYAPVRLNSFLDNFGQNVTRVSICNENLGPSVQQIANFFGEQLSPCLRGRPRDLNPSTPQYEVDCNVAELSYVPGTGMRERALPSCNRLEAAAQSTNLPCYTLLPSAECTGTETGLALDVFYPAGVTVPPGTRAVARCVAN